MKREFSRTERRLAKLLENNPKHKKLLKYGYQLVLYYVFKNRFTHILLESLNSKFSQGEANTFGGYYDKILINNKGAKLYHKIKNNEVEICLNKKTIARSRSWNFQQGCMLSFINESEIIFNQFENNNYRSVIKNLKSNKQKVFDIPIYTTSNSGRLSLCLSFERLSVYRPDYGYFNTNNPKLKEDDKDGVFKLDHLTNETSLILSLGKLKNFKPTNSMKGANHWVNHLMINQNESRFLFLHRWSTKEGMINSRLITSDLEGKKLYLLSDEKMVSHCCWKNSSTIIGWMRKENKDAYYELVDMTNTFNIVGDGILNQDGHPSVSSDEEWLLTDTYPDKSRMSKIILFNLKKNYLVEIGKFYTPLKWDPTKRCDLHPRFSSNNNEITFDSEHSGRRRINTIDISGLLSNE